MTSPLSFLVPCDFPVFCFMGVTGRLFLEKKLFKSRKTSQLLQMPPFRVEKTEAEKKKEPLPSTSVEN